AVHRALPRRLARPLGRRRRRRRALDAAEGHRRRGRLPLVAGRLAPGAGGPAAALRPAGAAAGRAAPAGRPRRRGGGAVVKGLLKGLRTPARVLARGAHTRQYPHEQPTLPERSRGVIALLEENCTSCMLCARECPDWCI